VDADAYAALAELAKRPEIDARRVAVLGFSRGAEAARQAAFESFRKGAGAGELRFSAHVAHYPLCVTSMRDPADMTGAPVRLVLGAKDDGTPPRLCEDYVAFMKAQQQSFPVEIRMHADAYHAWDEETATGGYSPRSPSSKNCIPLFLSREGEFSAMLREGKEVPFERSILRCPGAGGTLAFDAAVRERATAELIRFLKASGLAAN
jgi:dienelactone hydrolase